MSLDLLFIYFNLETVRWIQLKCGITSSTTIRRINLILHHKCTTLHLLNTMLKLNMFEFFQYGTSCIIHGLSHVE